MADEITSQDISQSWHLVRVRGGILAGIFRVSSPMRSKGVVRTGVYAVDAWLIYRDDDGNLLYERQVRALSAWIIVSPIPNIRSRVTVPTFGIDPEVRDDVLANLPSVEAAILSAANAATWPDDEGADEVRRG